LVDAGLVDRSIELMVMGIYCVGWVRLLGVIWGSNMGARILVGRYSGKFRLAIAIYTAKMVLKIV
jgi:hypothetical protein